MLVAAVGSTLHCLVSLSSASSGSGMPRLALGLSCVHQNCQNNLSRSHVRSCWPQRTHDLRCESAQGLFTRHSTLDCELVFRNRVRPDESRSSLEAEASGQARNSCHSPSRFISPLVLACSVSVPLVCDSVPICFSRLTIFVPNCSTVCCTSSCIHLVGVAHVDLSELNFVPVALSKSFPWHKIFGHPQCCCRGLQELPSPALLPRQSKVPLSPAGSESNPG